MENGMSSHLKTTRRVTIGGLAAGLSLVMLMATGLFPFATFALPALAGILLLPLCVDMGLKWSALVYAAVSLLGLLLAPDREAAFFYLGLFGQYPLVKALIESRCPRAFQWPAKILVCNLSLALCLGLTALAFGLEYLLSEYSLTGWWMMAAAAVAGNLVFVLYDIALTRILSVYVRYFRPKFRRFFP